MHAVATTTEEHWSRSSLVSPVAVACPRTSGGTAEDSAEAGLPTLEYYIDEVWLQQDVSTCARGCGTAVEVDGVNAAQAGGGEALEDNHETLLGRSKAGRYRGRRC